MFIDGGLGVVICGSKEDLSFLQAHCIVYEEAFFVGLFWLYAVDVLEKSGVCMHVLLCGIQARQPRFGSFVEHARDDP